MASRIVAVGLMALGLAYLSTSLGEPYDESGYGVATLEERVSKLEKRLSGNTLIEMSNRVEKLQAEVLRLRGQMEELSHNLERTQKQQRDMYTDLDQRLPKPGVSAPASAAPDIGGAPQPPVPGDGQAGSAVPPPGAVPTPSPTPPAADPAVRQAAYQKAFNTLKEGKYTDAIKEFKSFVAAYPSGDFTDNAYYWLAEAYYVNRDFPAARDNFRKVVKEFPQSAKVADAYLKLGFIEYENGQYAAAKDLLNDAVKRYPGTSAAKMAEKRLERMRQEKH